MATTINKGNIAEYIFAIAMGAVFRAKTTNKGDIQKIYFELKEELNEALKNTKDKKIVQFLNDKTNPTLTVSIKLGTTAPSELALNSLKYYLLPKNNSADNFNKDDIVKKYEKSAINFAHIFAQENKEEILKNNKSVVINSDGIVDMQSSKADVTLTVDGKKREYSIKTNSTTVNSASWNRTGVIGTLEKLFGIKLNDIAFPIDINNKEQQLDFYREVVKKVSGPNNFLGKTEKKKFIQGLRQLITKKDKDFDLFQLVKLKDENTFTSMIFSSDYEILADFFEYKIETDTSGNPKLKIKLELPTREEFNKEFAKVRTDGKKFLLEVGPSINLMANKYIKKFIALFDGDGKLSEKGKTESIYSQLRTTFNTVKFSEKDVLTEKGKYFVANAKKKLGVKNT